MTGGQLRDYVEMVKCLCLSARKDNKPPEYYNSLGQAVAASASAVVRLKPDFNKDGFMESCGWELLELGENPFN